jgi:hypothetical protein
MAKPRLPLPIPSRLMAAGTLSLVTSLSLAAQAQTLERPRPRQGYYLGGGLQFAATRVTESGESLGVWPGSVFTSRIGQMLTSHLGLGLGFQYGGTGRDPDFASFGGLSLGSQWEFFPNFALHASVGFGVVGLIDNEHPDDPLRGSYGGAYSLGLSYDWFPWRGRPSGGWALQPVTTVSYLPDSPVSTVIFTLGLEVMYWHGLPSNQLDLPAGEGYDRY